MIIISVKKLVFLDYNKQDKVTLLFSWKYQSLMCPVSYYKNHTPGW